MTSDASTKGPVVIFRCPGAKLALYTICLPIFAFLACIILSVVYNFEGATATHCGVSEIKYLDLENSGTRPTCLLDR